ncbi:MAG TPA: M12 family metallo-peptidase, partial [Phnomibacter sp.]|nr:M12 family metallo-peptidase [Phnomibacter sp.]
FEKGIPERDLPGINRIDKDLQNHYRTTRYRLQADFMKPEDMFIRLTPGLMIKSVFKQMINYPTGSFSYVGQIEGLDGGEVTFSKFRDRIAGMVILPDGTRYMIDQTGPGIFAISLAAEDIFIQREKGTDFIIPEEETDPSTVMPMSTGSLCEPESTCTGPSVIDLMVVFTPDAQNKWGGYNNTVANITQAVTNMNTSMTTTGVNNVTFRLVHAALVQYTESGSPSTDLSRLRSTNDGFMDEIHGWRTQYGADMVALIVGSAPGACGVGYLNSSPTAYSASSAFNVTLYSCAVGNYTLSHEFGHNMGLHHDWYVSSSTTPCPHHHGYVNQAAIQLGTASTSSQRWRTIMAYNDQCSAAGFSCSRLNRWSNPALTHNGDPTGRAIGTTNPADEATAFYRMACRVAALVSTAPTCAAPIGLNAGNITTASATLSWSTVSGASSYAVDYKQSSSSTWINISSNTTSTSVSLSGLSINTSYDWRVRANCGSANSTYGQAQFSTLAACATPAGLSTTDITISSATLSWTAVSGALHYDVDHKTSAAATWTNLASATTATTISLTDLVPSTTYNWRVRATCTAGAGNYAQATFSTTAPPVCNDPNEPNNNNKQGKNISFGSALNGAISTASDVDWFKFTSPNSNATHIRVTVYNLPANYDVYLYDKNISELGRSTNSGTTTEVIVYNNTIKRNAYNLLITGVGGSFDPSACYTVLVENSTTPFPSPDEAITSGDAATPNANDQKMFVYPIPAREQINIIVQADKAEPAQLVLTDITGRTLQANAVDVTPGTNYFKMNTLGYTPGMYLVRMKLSEGVITQKIIIQR